MINCWRELITALGNSLSHHAVLILRVRGLCSVGVVAEVRGLRCGAWAAEDGLLVEDGLLCGPGSPHDWVLRGNVNFRQEIHMGNPIP